MPLPYMPSALGSPSVSIPSVSEYLQFCYSVVPVSTSHPTVSHDKSWLTAHYLPSLYSLSLILSLSVAPYSIFPSVTFYADGLWSAFPLVVYAYFWLGGKIIKWVASSFRAFNALNTWWFPIGYAPDEASLRPPRLIIPYIMGALPLIFYYFIFADLWDRDRRPELVDLLFNLRQLLHCRPWSVPSRKTIYQ